MWILPIRGTGAVHPARDCRRRTASSSTQRDNVLRSLLTCIFRWLRGSGMTPRNVRPEKLLPWTKAGAAQRHETRMAVSIPVTAAAPAQPSAAIVTTDIPARLDRLRWGRFHTLVVVALGITWIL